MITKLQHEILTLLNRMGPCVSFERLARRVKLTEHDSRVRKCLDEMREKVWLVSDGDRSLTITNGGRKQLPSDPEPEEVVSAPSAPPQPFVGSLNARLEHYLSSTKEPLTRGEVARLCGCRTSSISRQISDLKRRGAITVYPKRACTVNDCIAQTMRIEG